MQPMSRPARDKECGMITVEAALVVPLLFFILLAMLYLALFYLDQAKVVGAGEVVLEYAAQSIGKSSDMGTGQVFDEAERSASLWKTDYAQEQAQIQQRLRDELQGKLMVLALDEVVVSVEHSRLELHCVMKGETGIFRYFHIDGITVSWDQQIELGNYAKCLRSAAARENTIEEDADGTE